MNDAAARRTESDPLLKEAAEWFARLQDPAIPLESVCEWQSWMSADPRHALAFHSLEDLWQDFGEIPHPSPPARAALAADRYDASVPVGEWRLARPKLRAPMWAAAASVSLAALAALVWVRPWSPAGELVETQVGENRTLTLGDGTGVSLGGRTALRVSLSRDERRLTLLRGEAFFDVAKDSARPFVVRAGAAEVTAIGTQFNVRRNDDRTVVSVVEGKVLVQRAPGVIRAVWPAAPSVERGVRPLGAGNRATVSGESSQPPSAEPAEMADATAWRSGKLAFESEPLRYVVEDVNRYAAKSIEIEDERIGELLITGTVRGDGVAAWLASLEPAFGIRAVVEGERYLLTEHRR
jgi:transmembrane sensor